MLNLCFKIDRMSVQTGFQAETLIQVARWTDAGTNELSCLACWACIRRCSFPSSPAAYFRSCSECLRRFSYRPPMQVDGCKLSFVDYYLRLMDMFSGEGSGVLGRWI